MIVNVFCYHNFGVPEISYNINAGIACIIKHKFNDLNKFND